VGGHSFGVVGVGVDIVVEVDEEVSAETVQGRSTWFQKSTLKETRIPFSFLCTTISQRTICHSRIKVEKQLPLSPWTEDQSSEKGEMSEWIKRKRKCLIVLKCAKTTKKDNKPLFALLLD